MKKPLKELQWNQQVCFIQKSVLKFNKLLSINVRIEMSLYASIIYSQSSDVFKNKRPSFKQGISPTYPCYTLKNIVIFPSKT